MICFGGWRGEEPGETFEVMLAGSFLGGSYTVVVPEASWDRAFRGLND